MKAALSYAVDPRVRRIIELTESLRELLRYPNSENSRDERHYTEWYEGEILKILDKKNGVLK